MSRNVIYSKYTHEIKLNTNVNNLIYTSTNVKCHPVFFQASFFLLFLNDERS